MLNERVGSRGTWGRRAHGICWAKICCNNVKEKLKIENDSLFFLKKLCFQFFFNNKKKAFSLDQGLPGLQVHSFFIGSFQTVQCSKVIRYNSFDSFNVPRTLMQCVPFFFLFYSQSEPNFVFLFIISPVHLLHTCP